MMYHLDWIASFAYLAGIHYVGNKRWYGWLCQCAGNLISGYIDVRYKLWGFMPLVVVSTFMVCKNARAWYLERKA